PPIGGFVERGPADFDPAEVEPGELPEHLVMVAGDIDDARAAPGALENPPDDIVVRRRPVELLLQPPAVDDVADEIERLAVGGIEEIDQQPSIAALGAEVDVADPDRAIAAALVRRRALGARHGAIPIGQGGPVPD